MPQDITYDHEHCEPMTTGSAIDISVAFATTLETPAHVELAEQLGFVRAWLYDTPQQSPDVWMCLALAAQRTRSIGLGPGVLVPTLSHPMVNAAAAAALEKLAPGRVAVGFGTGHTGRRALGQPNPIPWNYMSRYGPPGVTSFPGGKEWLAVVERTPEAHRHFAVHRDHLMRLNEADAAASRAGAHTLLTTATLSGRADEIRAKAAQLAANGVTELVYQPAGDIQRELETFAAAVELQPTGGELEAGWRRMHYHTCADRRCR
jgi:hypothetical protein